MNKNQFSNYRKSAMTIEEKSAKSSKKKSQNLQRARLAGSRVSDPKIECFIVDEVDPKDAFPVFNL